MFVCGIAHPKSVSIWLHIWLHLCIFGVVPRSGSCSIIPFRIHFYATRVLHTFRFFFFNSRFQLLYEWTMNIIYSPLYLHRTRSLTRSISLIWLNNWRQRSMPMWRYHFWFAADDDGIARNSTVTNSTIKRINNVTKVNSFDQLCIAHFCFMPNNNNNKLHFHRNGKKCTKEKSQESIVCATEFMLWINNSIVDTLFNCQRTYSLKFDSPL